jgi:aminoglycoside/choline kinase family phosphotransferase
MGLNKNIEIKLNEQFKKWSGSEALLITMLPNSGSNRIYFRLQNSNTSAIGVYNDNFKENTAFLNFTKQFLNSRINVPFIYSENLSENIYLIQDLGDTQMLQWLSSQRTKNEFPTEAISIYKKVIQELIRIQIIAGRNFDYSSCYPYTVFNEESIKFDLNYFKSNYIERLNLSYDSQKLGSDFNQFTSYLLKADNAFFMFRDFQARNIMLVNNQPYFIDYQGGRKGPLQYDLASLLFQAMAEIPENIKDLLLEYYIGLAQKFVPLNKSEFIEHYYAFALIRVMQTLGAYGLRGLIEKKNHFIKSIPLALQNLIYLLDKVEILNSLPELKKIIIQITSIETKTNEE